LKYGEKPKIGVHFKASGTESSEPMFQEFVTHGKETYQALIEKFVSLRSNREKTPYKKVELFWPHPLLKVIYDIIIWLCIKRTGNYRIHGFDWLKSILTAV